MVMVMVAVVVVAVAAAPVARNCTQGNGVGC